VPIPEKLMRDLDRCFSIRRAQCMSNLAVQRLWSWCRVTAWRVMKEAMKLAKISGPQACPRGLRHGFGVGMLQRRAPIQLIQRWMGHARLSTTMIYMDVCGPDEVAFAQPFWQALLFERERHAAPQM
jgi:integrase/recombinase XerD